jgi:ribosome maturation factor RimP
MIYSDRKRVQSIADRMRGLCATLRIHCPKSERHVSLETVEKWAREIEAALEREDA